MVASPDPMHGGVLIEQDKFSLLPTAAVYGANASGKSNLLKAVEAMRDFVLYSATGMNVGDSIPNMIPFRLDEDWRKRPSCFEIEAIVDETCYIYGFSATPDKVTSESLSIRRAGGRTVNRFRRDTDARTGNTKWSFRGLSKKDEKLLREKTRENGLLLSRAAELNFEEFGELYLWFHQGLRCFDLSDPPRYLMKQTASKAQKDVKFKERVLRMLRDADFGIQNILVKDRPLSPPDGIPEDLKSALANLLASSPDNTWNVAVQTTHFDGENKPVAFSLEHDESNGTQRFFSLAGPIIEALDSGATIVVDELECSMHPLLTRKIIELFLSREANPSGAQLIFSTHDSSLLDHTLFRRDQIWIAEKTQSGATELFSLHDFDGGAKPRKDEAFQRKYLSGRYGGVPKFGPTFEDLEVR
ncbi:MAG: ATP-binding protein [Planctomycetaceae bacterium]